MQISLTFFIKPDVNEVTRSLPALVQTIVLIAPLTPGPWSSVKNKTPEDARKKKEELKKKQDEVLKKKILHTRIANKKANLEVMLIKFQSLGRIHKIVQWYKITKVSLVMVKTV